MLISHFHLRIQSLLSDLWRHVFCSLSGDRRLSLSQRLKCVILWENRSGAHPQLSWRVHYWRFHCSYIGFIHSLHCVHVTQIGLLRQSRDICSRSTDSGEESGGEEDQGVENNNHSDDEDENMIRDSQSNQEGASSSDSHCHKPRSLSVSLQYYHFLVHVHIIQKKFSKTHQETNTRTELEHRLRELVTTTNLGQCISKYQFQLIPEKIGHSSQHSK